MQGPVADVRISEVSLGHTRNASKTAKAALSWQFRLPFTVRDLVIDIRQPAEHTSTTASKAAVKTSSRGTTSLTSHKSLLNTGLRLLLGILPNIPIRIKQLTVRQVSGLLLKECFTFCTAVVVIESELMYILSNARGIDLFAYLCLMHLSQNWYLGRS